jgi:hypothetical protein
MDYSLTLYHPLNPLLKELEVSTIRSSGFWGSGSVSGMVFSRPADDFLTINRNGSVVSPCERDVTFSGGEATRYLQEVALGCLGNRGDLLLYEDFAVSEVVY